MLGVLAEVKPGRQMSAVRFVVAKISLNAFMNRAKVSRIYLVLVNKTIWSLKERASGHDEFSGDSLDDRR